LVLPQIRGVLSATYDEIAWVVRLNLLARAVAIPTTGWLANRLGWRGVMFSGVGGFTLFSLLCGLANNLLWLILTVSARVCAAL
jgi:DHA2 family multidrug resistance protein